MTRARRALVALLVVVFGVVSSTPAQLVFDYEDFHSPAPNAGGKFGYNLLVLDIDHDGFDDLVATQEGCIVDGLFGSGCVWILRGPRFSDAIQIQSHQPAFLAGLGQNGVSMGDVNGDHVLDLLVGAPIFDTPTVEMGGRAHLFYGPDFRTEVIFDDPRPETRQNTVGGFTYHGFGAAVLLADLDGDGRDDIVIGAPQASDLVDGELVTNVGEVFIAYATDLTKLVRLRNPDPKPLGLFGFHLASIPLGSGRGDDLLVAAPLYDSLPLSPLKAGLLYLFPAKTLSPVLVIPPPVPTLTYSFFGEVQHVEDMDGDGVLDLFVAAPWTSNKGVLTLLRGPAFTGLIHQFASPDVPLNFGEAVAVADVNWDGASDVVIGDPGKPSALKEAVRIFYGPDFTSMQSLGLEFTVELPGFGKEVATGDFDGDRIPEIAIARTAGFDFGAVRIANQRTLHTETTAFSLSAGATVDLALDLGPMAAGEGYLGLLSVTPPGEGLVVGKGCYLPLAPDAVTFAALALLDTPVLQDFHGVLDEQGRASLALQWPAGLGQELAGSTLRLAVLTFDADGRPSVGSNALALALEH